MNHGILAQQFGHVDEADLNWREALKLDPAQDDADLYLALDLEKQDKFEDAIGHYQNYLTKVVKRPASNIPLAANLISVVLKLADCNARANHPDLAVRHYEIARTLAEQAEEKKLESFADVAEAALQAKRGETSKALPLYQSALQLDAGLHDPHSEGVDWFMYATFLRDAGFPPRFAYASLLKSRSLLGSDTKLSSNNVVGSETNTKDADAIRSVCKELENRVGAQASGISRNPEPLWHEALELKR